MRHGFAKRGARTSAGQSEQCGGTEAQGKYWSEARDEQGRGHDPGRHTGGSASKASDERAKFLADALGLVFGASEENDGLFWYMLLQ